MFVLRDATAPQKRRLTLTVRRLPRREGIEPFSFREKVGDEGNTVTFLMRAFSACVLALALLALPATAAELRDANTFFSLNMGALKADLTEARADGKQALLVMFEQEGCPGCAHMRRHVLSQPGVQDYFRKHFTNLSLDIYGSVPLEDVSGRESTEKDYAQRIKVRMTPTFIFYDLKGAEIVRYSGPFETPAEFMLFGQFVASGAYKKTTFIQYKTQKPRGG
jgi:thioredoxin-related protein